MARRDSAWLGRFRMYRLPGTVLDSGEFRSQDVQLPFGGLQPRPDLAIGREKLAMLFKIVIHVAVSSFGRIQWNHQLRHSRIEVVHYGQPILSLCDPAKVCL